MLAPWKKNYDKPRQCPKKQRHHFADRGLSSQRHGFSGSRVWMWELDRKEGWLLSRFSPVQFFVTLRTAAWQAPPSMRFSRQEYWNGLPRPPPEDLPDSGSSLCLLNWEAASLSLVPPRSQRRLSTKERCFWSVVLEQNLDSTLRCKEIKPVNFKGN